MAFITLKTIVFLNKKTARTSQFCSFYCLFITYSRYYRPNMTMLWSNEGVKGIGFTKSNVYNEVVMTLLATTRVFHKKESQFFIFVFFFLVFFVDMRYILDNCKSQMLPLEKMNLFNCFI